MSLQTDINAAIAAVLAKYKVADTTAVSPPPQTFAVSLPKIVSIVGDVTFYDDGTTSLKKIDDYIAANWDGKTGQPIHNYFWEDSEALWDAAGLVPSTVAVDNINYNISNVHSPATVGLFRGNMTDFLQGFSAVLKNYFMFKQYDPKTVTALPYSLASPNKSTDVDAIIKAWSTLGPNGTPYVPTVLTRTWNVV